MSDLVNFSACVLAFFDNPELMAGYRRLTGESYCLDTRGGLERAIDEATGRDPKQDPAPHLRFILFVQEVVWERLPAKVRDPVGAPPPLPKGWMQQVWPGRSDV